MRILINNNKKSKNNSDYSKFYKIEYLSSGKCLVLCSHEHNIYFVSNSCGWNSSSKLTWTCQLDMGYIYAYEEKDIRFICNNQQQCVIGQCHGNYGRLTDWKLFLF